VTSPFHAIRDYEISNKIPQGWVSFSISRTSPGGSWHQLERGEIRVDEGFFSSFNRDLRIPSLWEEFYGRLRKSQAISSIPSAIPPMPEIDGEALFWEMMRISRIPDPYMFPALMKLQATGRFVLGALSNTVLYPDGHPYNEDSIGLKTHFDLFISSAHTGLRKPDPKIYQLALTKIGNVAENRGIKSLSASDVLFLDDIGENLRAAKLAGMRTLKVNIGRTQDAVKELEQITGIQLLEEESSKL
jgi:FMN phosphatase YigB (HAD superfamily)